MCRQINRIDVKATLDANRGRRTWIVIVTKCKAHNTATLWTCTTNGQFGQYDAGNGWRPMPTSGWDVRLQKIVREGVKSLESPKRAAVKRPRRERNEIKARKLLSQWQRKLKIAEGKVKKYAAVVGRYERANTKLPTAYVRLEPYVDAEHSPDSPERRACFYHHPSDPAPFWTVDQYARHDPRTHDDKLPYYIGGKAYKLQWLDGSLPESPILSEIDVIFDDR